MKRIGSLLTVVAVAVAGCGPNDPGAPAVTLLSPEGANHRDPVFSPDGRQVAYVTPKGAEWELVVAQADLSQPRTVATSGEITAPLWSPDGAWLAYATNAWGAGPDVAIVPAAGGEVRRLTTSPALEIPVAWAPGGRVAYLQTAEGGTIRASVVSIAGGEGTPLLSDSRPHFAAWSPDGSRVAINFIVGGGSTIWIADSTGGNLRQLTTEGLEELGFGVQAWSPDGSELAYLSRHTGTADIWVMPLDGGPARQLTKDLRDDTDPVWSPDGRWVAFVSTRGQQTDIWVVASTGGEAIRVTDDATEEAGVQWIGPGGTQLGFQARSSASTLWAIDAAGGTERQITPDSIRVGGFRVSPDGEQVAYIVERGGGVTDIQVAPLAGGPPRVLVAGSNENWLAGWSPDGQTILFESNRGGNVDVWTVSAAGGAPRQLTNWPTFETNPAWTADGSGIYFLSDRDAKLRDLWLVPAAGGEPRRITTVGSINAITRSSSSPDLFVGLLGGRAGQFVLARLEADGSLRTLWDRSNVGEVSPDAVMRGADSVVINADLPEGGIGSFLISTRTGEGRQLLGKGEEAADFSRDGTLLAYTFGGATQDLGIIDMKDGTTRRLTNTPERESGYWWAGDTKTIVVARRSQRSRIATVDVGALLGR